MSTDKKFVIINHIVEKNRHLNFVSLVGSFTANVLRLLSSLSRSIETSTTIVATLVILAFMLPISLGTMIIGVGFDLTQAVANKQTPNRVTVIGVDLILLGLASTALMVAFEIISATILGLSIGIPLIFAGITVVNIYKDNKLLTYKRNKYEINDRIIQHHKALLQQYIQKLGNNKKAITNNSIVQRLSLTIAEAQQENANLKIEQDTLLSTHKSSMVSLFAVGLLVVSALFPPFSLFALTLSVIGVGIFLGVNIYNTNLKKKRAATTIRKKKSFAAIQNEIIQNTLKIEVSNNQVVKQIKERVKQSEKISHSRRFFDHPPEVMISTRASTCSAYRRLM